MTSLSKPARVTIREVAQHAGVGIKTVSRVVNNEPNVAPATAARVRASIEELRWEPDAHAANLRRTTTRTRSVGLLLGSVANPFSATIHRAVEDIAVHRDVAVFASSLDDDPEREVAAVEAFVRRKVDGLILTCVAESQAYLAELVPPEMPVVFIDREASGYVADTVLSDNVEGARLATRHLLGFGHRRLALLIDRRDIWTARERERGFLAALAEFGVPAETATIVADLSGQHAAERAVTTLLSAPDAPTAIVSGQNLITVGAVHALRKLGRHHDVALIGFDDVELADLMDPGLSVVAQRPKVLGRLAAERLFASLDAGHRLDPAPIVVPVDLVPRGSGEIRPTQP
ncbi:LacI family DNA-binding transcriptional regulator [Microbacterium capsulatum]|uniref:LacI family DNA-binding transcriptional regulator n=1 Tax=Microbacterium capsulatum TaxID=3041921 RepID=A0ABU0XK49_9MICO|nr:LacI family DNA-binding transcriptional regulator [Microbacterium sp. ASV81]MDQ4215503.1 LacI family DNA-binding transcriptional regulator [Microbacterium sp. ASV81]